MHPKGKDLRFYASPFPENLTVSSGGLLCPLPTKGLVHPSILAFICSCSALGASSSSRIVDLSAPDFSGKHNFRPHNVFPSPGTPDIFDLCRKSSIFGPLYRIDCQFCSHPQRHAMASKLAGFHFIAFACLMLRRLMMLE